jgi:hypothetical protein
MTLSIEFTMCPALDEPQRTVTPGQPAVMFSGDVVLGGGHRVVGSRRVRSRRAVTFN